MRVVPGTLATAMVASLALPMLGTAKPEVTKTVALSTVTVVIPSDETVTAAESTVTFAESTATVTVPAPTWSFGVLPSSGLPTTLLTAASSNNVSMTPLPVTIGNSTMSLTLQGTDTASVTWGILNGTGSSAGFSTVLTRTNGSVTIGTPTPTSTDPSSGGKAGSNGASSSDSSDSSTSSSGAMETGSPIRQPVMGLAVAFLLPVLAL